MMSSSGSCTSVIASASICCWPPDRSAAAVSKRSASIGNSSIDLSMRRSCSLPVVEERGHAQVLPHGERAERRAAADELHDADPDPQLGVGVGDRAAAQPDDAAFGDPESADDAQQRRLAGAVGAEQGERLAFVHVEPDVEQHLHLAVREVEVAHLEHRDDRRRAAACGRVLRSPRGGPRRPSPCRRRM